MLISYTQYVYWKADSFFQSVKVRGKFFVTILIYLYCFTISQSSINCLSDKTPHTSWIQVAQLYDSYSRIDLVASFLVW
jgi:hypothetical protein